MLALRTASLAGMEDESYSGSESNLDSEEEEEEEEESEEDEEEEDDDDTARDAAEGDGDSAGGGEEEEEEAGGEGRPPKDPAASAVPSRKRADRAAALGTPRGTAIARKRQKSSTRSGHMRRNIRKLLRPEQLEADTLAAQLEELERRKRLEQTAYKSSQPDGSALEEGTRESEVICVSSSEDDAPSHGDVIELSSEDEAVHVIGSESSGSSADEAGADDAEAEAAAAAASAAALGSHCNDARNQPDAAGRVLVNVNRPPDEPDIFMAPQLARVVKPHQIGGIRFLYDNLVESQERYSTTSGFGCILAHSMGLGKTLQLISFIDVLFRHTDARTVLAIVPVNTLQNWLAEFNHWLPPAGHRGTGQGGTGQATGNPGDATEEAQPRTFAVHILNDDHKTTVARARVIAEWSAGGGVLLMGYEMFRLLSLKKASLGSGRKKKPKKEVGPVIIDLDEEDRQQELLLDVEKALTRPGADVVICDEGHRIKNCHASTAQALKAVRTRRRVVLTGYPLQNNLIEYWCMVDFVRPNFLGTRQEFSNLFERPILNGQCVDSTPQDMRLMRYRSHVLHSLLEGFVQRRGHNVLTATLPAKEEHVLLVRLSPIQRALYRHFMLRFQEAGSSGWLGSNPLKAYCVCCKIWNHPDILFDALQKESIAADPDLDLEVSDLPAGLTRERGASGGSSGRRKVAKREVADLELPNGRCGAATQSGPERGGQVVTYEWARDLMGSYQTGVLEHSAKMVLLFHLVEESVRHGDKILVFSQSLSTLDIIEAFLSQRKIPTVSGSASPSAPSAPSDPSDPSAPSASSAPPAETQVPPAASSPTGLVWSKNVNYFRLDGSTATSEREKLINQFNNPLNSSVWLFLLSTRAGCLGINLIGANRVVIFDASWNPCHDAQAVCRIFRYGQVKPCFVYRLVSDFTLEKKIYDRQISKQGMSNRVVDDMNPVLNFTRHEVENLLHLVEEEEAAPVDLPSIAQRHHDPLLRTACLQHSRLLTKEPFTHESLLMERSEYRLTPAEKRLAKKSYEDEKRACVPYQRPSYAQFYPSVASSLSSLTAFTQQQQQHHRLSMHAGLKSRPVANVPPMQTTPVPMLPRVVPAGSGLAPGVLNPAALTMSSLQRAGVNVQRIVTTTDIVVPGSHTSTNTQAKISAGENIFVIQGNRGVYIRTNDGKIFAVRSGPKHPGRTIPGGEVVPVPHSSSQPWGAAASALGLMEAPMLCGPDSHELPAAPALTHTQQPLPGDGGGGEQGSEEKGQLDRRGDSALAERLRRDGGHGTELNGCAEKKQDGEEEARTRNGLALSPPGPSSATSGLPEPLAMAPLAPLGHPLCVGPTLYPYQQVYGDPRLYSGGGGYFMPPSTNPAAGGAASHTSSPQATLPPSSAFSSSTLAQTLLRDQGLREHGLLPSLTLPAPSLLPATDLSFLRGSGAAFPALAPQPPPGGLPRAGAQVAGEQIVISSDDSD
ncbi:helicase ARIP4 isoform X1 [Petromyzon marinus]|uniref:helicase ARIP4 isoform X1 n=1 Tax=Petromyzon marinus TaxID=7757 RepID=UPI003F71AC46